MANSRFYLVTRDKTGQAISAEEVELNAIWINLTAGTKIRVRVNCGLFEIYPEQCEGNLEKIDVREMVGSQTRITVRQLTSGKGITDLVKCTAIESGFTPVRMNLPRMQTVSVEFLDHNPLD